MTRTADNHAEAVPEDEIVLVDRAIRRAMAVHKALGVPWATWGPNGVTWIPPEELPELPREERGVLPTSSAPRPAPRVVRREPSSR